MGLVQQVSSHFVVFVVVSHTTILPARIFHGIYCIYTYTYKCTWFSQKNMYKQIDSALSNKTSYIFACGEMLFHKKFFTKALHLNFQIHIEMSTLSSMKFGSHTTLLIKTIKSEKLVWFIGPSCSLLIGDCSWGSWTTRAEDNSYSSRCRLTSVVDASDPFVGNVGRDDMGISSAESSQLHCTYIPWICYERNFSEFYLSIWNQLIFNQRLQLFVRSPQPYLLVFAWWK